MSAISESSSNRIFLRPWQYRLMDTIANRVKALRISKRLSQRKLALECGVSQPTIANIELGRTTEIKGYVLEALARELSTTGDYILNGVSEDATHEQTMMLSELKKIFCKLAQDDQHYLIRIARGLLQTPSDISPFPSKVAHQK